MDTADSTEVSRVVRESLETVFPHAVQQLSESQLASVVTGAEIRGVEAFGGATVELKKWLEILVLAAQLGIAAIGLYKALPEQTTADVVAKLNKEPALAPALAKLAPEEVTALVDHIRKALK